MFHPKDLTVPDLVKKILRNVQYVKMTDLLYKLVNLVPEVDFSIEWCYTSVPNTTNRASCVRPVTLSNTLLERVANLDACFAAHDNQRWEFGEACARAFWLKRCL